MKRKGRIYLNLRPIRLALAALLLLGSGVVMAADAAGVSLNMRDVDIRTVIDTVADVTRRTFLVDPRVKGNVTIISSQPMTREELYEAFLSILQVHGYAAVETGNIVKVIPDASAKQIGGPTYTEGGDQGDDDNLVTKVIALQYVEAAQLVPVLRPLVPQDGHLAGYPDSNVLLITDRESNIARLSQIIERIDRPTGDEIEVIRLEYANATEVVNVVSKLQRAKQKGGAPSQTLLAADERSNSILASGDPADRVRIRGLVAHLDVPLERTGDTNVIFLKYAQASELTTLLQGRFKSQQTNKGDGSRSVDIQADTYNNALVVTAPPKEFSNIQSVVRQLDIRRAQVLVEAVIAEVSTDLSRELGVQLAGADRSGNSGPAFGTNLGPTSLTDLLQAAAAGTAVSIPTGLTAGLGNLSSNGFNWAILVSALAGDAATNILSTPSLLATDNEEAEIVVGQNVPFITGQYASTTAGSTTTSVNNPFQTIERQDIGITLMIKPQINEGSSVRLEIKQEVSSLSTTSVSASDLVTNKRSINTTITVEDGQIIVLGGLIEDRFQDSEQKVPLLGDVPLLGQLFRYSKTSKVKQNLMVFLRPTIIRDPELANHYSGRKYSYLRGRQLDAQLNARGTLVAGTPQLPPTLDDLFNRDNEQVPALPDKPKVPDVPANQGGVFPGVLGL